MNDRTKGIAYVTAQFALLALLFFWPANQSTGETNFWLAAAGFVLAMVGIAILLTSFVALGKSLTALPKPKQNAELVTTGLYRFVRHPIYTGLILLGLGQVFSAGSLPQVIFYVLLLGLLVSKSRFEESLLRLKYPEYDAYAKRTGRFIPGLK